MCVCGGGGGVCVCVCVGGGVTHHTQNDIVSILVHEKYTALTDTTCIRIIKDLPSKK